VKSVAADVDEPARWRGESGREGHARIPAARVPDGRYPSMVSTATESWQPGSIEGCT
jgi:hypothetical protein